MSGTLHPFGPLLKAARFKEYTLGILSASSISHAGIQMAAFGYVLAALSSWLPAARHREGGVRLTLGLSWLLCTVMIGVRWQDVGHGPFINLYEILLSNLWSLGLAVLIAIWLGWSAVWLRSALAVLAVNALWLLVTEPRASPLPDSYFTGWLYAHVLTGKVFLGCLLLAASLAIWGRFNSGAAPAGQGLDRRIHALVAVAFMFETLMLIFGGIWAQDAWGRYWAWDPLETWSFMTWWAVLVWLHGRRQWSGTMRAVWIVAAFVLAFLTFFGVPFISSAPHKGMI